jgi:pseudaminic acid synthase
VIADFNIGSFKVGPHARPFIVAEMSGNHNRSLERAMEIVESAAKSGAHAVKLQTYTADTMTLDCKTGPYLISDPKSLWYGKTLYEVYQEAATPYEWHRPIMDRCRALGMECFSTPFDESAVDFLESLNVSCYKIASFELTDLPLLRKVARTRKPIIMSTGMASLGEISDAVEAVRSAGCSSMILLKCTSTYPATAADTNIATIPHLQEAFGVQVGLSDHTMGLGVSVAAVALGATFIEKHYTLRRADGGVDSAFSMEPHELQMLVKETENAWLARGKVTYGGSANEQKSKIYRRAIVVTKDMKAGEILARDNIKCLRPGLGLEPKYYESVLGRRLIKDSPKGTPVTWDLV